MAYPRERLVPLISVRRGHDIVYVYDQRLAEAVLLPPCTTAPSCANDKDFAGVANAATDIRNVVSGFSGEVIKGFPEVLHQLRKSGAPNPLIKKVRNFGCVADFVRHGSVAYLSSIVEDVNNFADSLGVCGKGVRRKLSSKMEQKTKDTDKQYCEGGGADPLPPAPTGGPWSKNRTGEDDTSSGGNACQPPEPAGFQKLLESLEKLKNLPGQLNQLNEQINAFPDDLSASLACAAAGPLDALSQGAGSKTSNER
eukprot:TRINITY_DN26134_c0_g2_i2.p1 TRINITY_DN26134_c0_g2~~TRINITY_DN26134_c0_g2_i2.p1  ORF type:complete len:254 (-),score=40.51 TRINITY_DN26134_c0_g2_i2:35-796(-)